jgi:hypothetical protein
MGSVEQRELNLAVREYFRAKELFEDPRSTVKMIATAGQRMVTEENKIRKYIPAITEAELQSLPFNG